MTPLQVTVMCLVEPGAFREMHSFVQKSCDGSGRLEVISLAATEDVPSVHAAPAHDSLPGVPGGPRAVLEPLQQASPAVSSPGRQASSLFKLLCQPYDVKHADVPMMTMMARWAPGILADAL